MNFPSKNDHKQIVTRIRYSIDQSTMWFKQTKNASQTKITFENKQCKVQETAIFSISCGNTARECHAVCVLKNNHKIIILLIILLFFNNNISKEMMTNSDRNLCQRLFDQTQNELCGVNILYRVLVLMPYASFSFVSFSLNGAVQVYIFCALESCRL